MTRAGRRFVTWYSVALVAALALPYIIAFSTASGSEWEFTGFLVGVEDGNSYIAKMRRAAEGDWLFRSPYSAVPQRGVVAFLPYVLLGKLADGAGVHVQLVSLFHMARLMLIALEVLAVYRFAGLFLGQERWRRWATVMATLGGGLGWILILGGQPHWLGSLPLDVHSPESFGFLALLGLPHLVLARSLLLIGLADYIQVGESDRRSWRAGLWLALLALVHPLSAAAAALVLAAHVAFVALVGALRRTWSDLAKVIAGAVRGVVPMIPILLYYVWSFSTDPYLKGWTEQNRILSPSPWHYLVAYGLVLIPGIAGGISLVRRSTPFRWLLVSWALALPLLAYAPTDLQRRMPEGIWVALVVLAALGLMEFAKLTQERRWAAAWAILCLSLPTTLVVWMGSLRAATQPAPPAFVPDQLVREFEWVDAHLSKDSVIAANFGTSNALPAWADVFVISGHGPESADLQATLPRLNDFLAGRMAQEDAERLLGEFDVEAVVITPVEAGFPVWSEEAPFGLARTYSERGYVVLVVEH